MTPGGAVPDPCPGLSGPSAGTMLRAALDCVNLLPFVQGVRKALLSDYLQRIEVAFPGWVRGGEDDGADGSVIISGRGGEAIVLDPSGVIYRGNLKVVGATTTSQFRVTPGGRFDPVYPNLRRWV